MARPVRWVCVVAFVFGIGGFSLIDAYAPGLFVTAEVSATATEESENMIAIGQDIVVIVKDREIFKRQVKPLIGHTATFCLVEP